MSERSFLTTSGQILGVKYSKILWNKSVLGYFSLYHRGRGYPYALLSQIFDPQKILDTALPGISGSTSMIDMSIGTVSNDEMP